MKTLLKIIHSLSAAGLIGALACYLILLGVAPPVESLAEYALLREAIARVSSWVLVPSLLGVLTSGLLSIAVYRPFHGARWAWAKALLGLPMFEGTLVAVVGPIGRTADLAVRRAAGDAEALTPVEMAGLEPGAVWVILAVSLASIAIGIWRPTLSWRPR